MLRKRVCLIILILFFATACTRQDYVMLTPEYSELGKEKAEQINVQLTSETTAQELGLIIMQSFYPSEYVFYNQEDAKHIVELPDYIRELYDLSIDGKFVTNNYTNTSHYPNEHDVTIHLVLNNATFSSLRFDEDEGSRMYFDSYVCIARTPNVLGESLYVVDFGSEEEGAKAKIAYANNRDNSIKFHEETLSMNSLDYYWIDNIDRFALAYLNDPNPEKTEIDYNRVFIEMMKHIQLSIN